MLPRKWRAYSRGGPPSGATRATMLETSRRRLRRFRTGGRPVGAQVVPRRARKVCPVSSRKATALPVRRAPFYAGPVPPQPRLDERVVALPRAGDRLLGTPAPGAQGAAQRAEVVPDAERPLDHGRDPPQRPPLGLEPGGDGPPPEPPQQLAPLRRREAGGPPGRPAAAQATRPRLLQAALPVRHGGAADAHLARDLGLGQPLGAQQPPGREAALLQLRPRESCRLPHDGPPSHRSYSLRC
jgi:hypothetical protein